MAQYNECRCIGRPLRFVPGECFTCGRFLPGFAGRLSAAEQLEVSRPGLGALLVAVERKQVEMRLRFPAPRHHHRRVVIEPRPQSTHTRRGERSHELRTVEFANRTF